MQSSVSWRELKVTRRIVIATTVRFGGEDKDETTQTYTSDKFNPTNVIERARDLFENEKKNKIRYRKHTAFLRFSTPVLKIRYSIT